MDLHNGTLAIDSTAGFGTTVTLRLPEARVQRQSDPHVPRNTATLHMV
jgi:signal transduction histidine kinase